MQSLSSLKPQETGVVKKIGSRGALRRRIIDMGITPGVRIKVVKRAPLGDPIEVSVHGYNLSIRKSDAAQIELYSKDEERKVLKDKKTVFSGVSEHFSLPPVPSRNAELENYNIALIGNPNSGKTTLFNSLTGSYQYVGNWPGVTVARKEGQVKNTELPINLVDLTGVYSLSPYSPEEIVTRNYIINESPDLIINILDATNLERNLYLTTQLMELGCRIILVLNMSDLLARKGKVIDVKLLEQKLGLPVVSVSAGKNAGIDVLLQKIEKILLSKENTFGIRPVYSPEIEFALKKIGDMISEKSGYSEHERFKSVKIFEDDPLVITETGITANEASGIEKMRDNISRFYDKDKDILIADERYQGICSLCDKAIKTIKKEKSLTRSYIADKILTGKYTTIPCF
ncbi:MAG: fused ferrous iron transport protein A/B, partial [Clostridia bacterium]|nr:fused ferrous iron transport protein A/B [Clostridia bacterium]